MLAWPWSPTRLATAVRSIGAGRPWGTWRSDPFNHRLEVWLPFGIVWVIGGNHSLTAGVAQGTGTVSPRRVRDVSAVLDHVRCDGEAYYRVHDGFRLAPVASVELAAIFEIGRLLRTHGVSPWPEVPKSPWDNELLGSYERVGG